MSGYGGEVVWWGRVCVCEDHDKQRVMKIAFGSEGSRVCNPRICLLWDIDCFKLVVFKK